MELKSFEDLSKVFRAEGGEVVLACDTKDFKRLRREAEELVAGFTVQGKSNINEVLLGTDQRWFSALYAGVHYYFFDNSTIGYSHMAQIIETLKT